MAHTHTVTTNALRHLDQRFIMHATHTVTTKALRQLDVQDSMAKRRTVQSTRDAHEQAQREVDAALRRAKKDRAHNLKNDSRWLQFYKERQVDRDLDQRQAAVGRVRDGRFVQPLAERIVVFVGVVAIES
jgi:hypothetical protein